MVMVNYGKWYWYTGGIKAVSGGSSDNNDDGRGDSCDFMIEVIIIKMPFTVQQR